LFYFKEKGRKMLLCKKIKIELTEVDTATLEFMQGKCRGLYNWWIMCLRAGEKWPGWKKAKASLQESRLHDPELNEVYGKLLQEVYFRLDGSMQAFFRRVKNGEKPGFPRVRPRRCFFTLIYPAMYIQVEDNRLLLPTGGHGRNKKYANVSAKLTEEVPEDYHDVAISRDARGNYYASFLADEQEVPFREDGVVAFDLGVKTLAVGTNEQGRLYQIGGAKGHRWYNKQLDKIRSKRDRCQKGSKRYKRLSNTSARVSEKKRNKQRDSLHKASHLICHTLVERTVVVGDLSQRQMVTNAHQQRNRYLNRAVYNDWGLSLFVQMLVYKCVLYGKELVILDERDTSKTCSCCGHTQPMPLYKRTYRCPECGLVLDRDVNSAINILKRFLARLGPPMGDPIGRAAVFPAIVDVNTFEHI
jgi:putative transposase